MDIKYLTRGSDQIQQKWRLFGSGLAQPTQIYELRAFLGLCIYYGDIIPDLQERVRMLNGLTGKSKFVWTLEKEVAFNDLKFVLSSSNVVLQFPDMRKPFELSTDASDSSFGCVLFQRNELG